ncbi:MAG: iron-containing alcohol dehydrogenase [Pseudomonadota bacterium]
MDVRSMHLGQVTSFFIPTITVIGQGAAKEIPERLASLGASKPLIVTDQGIVAVGILKQVTDILEGAGCAYGVYDKTIPNPTDINVDAAFAVYQAEGCDSLITLGGGSSHDCGKGVGFLASNGGKIHDYEGVNKSSNPFPPYVAVNTTAGTASEMTRFCIITDTSRKVKMAIVDWRCTPSIALDDPLLMMGMPPSLTAATGMDALTHAVEAYVSIAATPITDACAERAIICVSDFLRRAVANGRDVEAREGMCYAQYLGGMAFNNASLGHVHAMAHQLGGFYDLPHGECNAILLPHVSQYNLMSNRRRYARIAELMGENLEGLTLDEAAQAAIDAIKKLSSDVGIPAGLVELGKRYGKDVREEDIPTMTANAQKDACGLTNPRLMSDAAVAAIYKGAL